MSKLIFFSGGVCSSLGKGLAASSLGALLESRGYHVRMIKCDPYINVDAGMQSPYQHGEIYVTDDGAETDLDLGNYARFTSGPLSQANSITTGQVYNSVISKEREGHYQGRCVQVIPHITDEIKARIAAVAEEDPQTEIAIVEIGGTVGDIESIPFLEAARQLIHESGRSNVISVHLTLIPEVGGEHKTKPTQHSVKAMQEMGIQPDILICRAPMLLDVPTREKISLFTNIEYEAVFTSVDVETTIYELPLTFYEQKLDLVVLKKLGLEPRSADIKPWVSVMDRVAAQKEKLRIAVVGKYMELHDAYKSVYEALFHGGLENGTEVELVKIDAAQLEEAEFADAIMGPHGLDGVVIPGGFGQRGSRGMILAAQWAREKKVPFLGICLGLYAMVIEWGKNVLGWEDADSTEFSAETTHPVIDLTDGQMRLGKYEALLSEGTRIAKAYGAKSIFERHRHKHEFANRYRDEMASSGLVISSIHPELDLVESVEWPSTGDASHPWGVGVQFHPEFKSRPTSASPLYRDFVSAAREQAQH